jgi:hypothetical protein
MGQLLPQVAAVANGEGNKQGEGNCYQKQGSDVHVIGCALMVDTMASVKSLIP